MSKLQDHLDELGENTTGNAHDSVTFAGKGLSLLKNLFKGAKKSDDEDLGEEEDEEEEDEEETPKKKVKKEVKKSVKANGGELEEEEEDIEDPGQKGKDEIITNHGKRVSGKGAVKKNASFFDEVRFEKSFDDLEEKHEEVLDASDALTDLAKQMRRMAKSSGESMNELQNTVLILGRALEKSLQAQSSLAADMELIKKQPVGNPSPGYVVMTKSTTGGKTRTLSKSDIADVVADAMNEGLVDSSDLARLNGIRSQADLQAYVNDLPASVQEQL